MAQSNHEESCCAKLELPHFTIPNLPPLLLRWGKENGFGVARRIFYEGLRRPLGFRSFSVSFLNYYYLFLKIILICLKNRFLLKEDDIEYLIVHLGGFLLDLTIGFWLLWPRSRPLAMFFGASFHVMNSQMFPIGIY